MALSLADELAGFDDLPGDMRGGGLSLAEEFGLDLEQDESLMIDHSAEDSAIEEQNDRGLKNEASGFDHDPLSGTFDDLDAGIQGGLPRSNQNSYNHSHSLGGYRMAKSSSSTMYGTTSTDSEHDGTDVDAMLDTTFVGTSYETALEDLGAMPSGPDIHGRGFQVPRNPYANGQSDRSESVEFLGYKVEKDPLEGLKDILVSNQSFLENLIHIDETFSLLTPTQTRRYHFEPIEVRLQRHLERLYEEDKRREEQCRELAVLTREVLGYRWDGEIELEIATGKGLGLGMINEVDNDIVEEQQVGWDGDPKGSNARPHFAEMVGGQRSDSPEIERLDPIKLIDTYPSVSSLKSVSSLPTGSTEETGLSALTPLSKTLRLLQSTTPDLITTLINLSDTIHSTTSFTNSSSRSLRGIRAGIESWKDRDSQEEQARKGVEEFERKRLEAGLKGGESVKMVLERELRGFEGVLSGLQAQMERLQRDSRVRLALR